MYPVTLETILRTEVIFFSKLLAVWALQRAGVVLAVFACALAGGVCRHRVRWYRAYRGFGRGENGLIVMSTLMNSAQGVSL
jgi:hypothetical protein